MPIRILIVDDHKSAIREIRSLLEANPEWEVCGEAVNGQEALARANELQPDVIVLDFAMPVMNGLRAAQEITRVLPTVPIVLNTLYSSPQVELEARKHGIRKVVEKTHSGALVSAIQELVEKNPEGGCDSTSCRNTSTRSCKSCFTSRSHESIRASDCSRTNVGEHCTSPGRCHQDGLNTLKRVVVETSPFHQERWTSVGFISRQL